MSALLARLEALTDFLTRHETLWRHRPFVQLPAPWEAERPALSAWLRGLSPEVVEAHAASPEAAPGAPASLVALASSARELSALPRLVSAPLPGPQPRRVPGRKWTQVAAFGGFAVPRLGGAAGLTDWCAGVGHLGRALSGVTGLPLVALERQASLCATGEAEAARAGVSARFFPVDVLREPLPDGALGPGRSLVALHACGDLTSGALAAAVSAGARSVMAAPCCYHTVQGERYVPLSRAGAARNLTLNRKMLWLPCAEEVTGTAARRRLRRREMVYRAALNTMVASEGYLSFRAVPPAWVIGDFEGFARAVAEREGLTLMSRDFAGGEAAGRAHVRAASALALVRALFRRPLEVWLALERALFLAEAGWSVSLGTFCERSITPRNIAIVGNRRVA